MMATATNGFDFYPAKGRAPGAHELPTTAQMYTKATLINLQHGNDYRNAQPLYGDWMDSVRVFDDMRVVFFTDSARRVVWAFV